MGELKMFADRITLRSQTALIGDYVIKFLDFLGKHIEDDKELRMKKTFDEWHMKTKIFCMFNSSLSRLGDLQKEYDDAVTCLNCYNMVHIFRRL